MGFQILSLSFDKRRGLSSQEFHRMKGLGP